jgi:cupin fold WbuC family metalloprotein
MKPLKIIDRELLNRVSEKAKASPRLRMNHNFHDVYSDPINRMLNALEPGTYCQPHKHEYPDKREVFLVLRGQFAVFFFDEKGAVTQIVKLCQTDEVYGVDIPPRVWHTWVCLEPGSVAYEVKDGPYVKPDDKDFAPWAPTEGSPDTPKYLETLLNQISKYHPL